MSRKAKLPFDPKVFLAKVNGGDEPFPTIGRIKSCSGRAILRMPFSTFRAARSRRPSSPSRGRKPWSHFWDAGDFFGEGCLAGEALRLSTVSALTKCVIARISKAEITRVIHEEPAFAELFISHLLARNSRVEEDLVDQLFNSSEKRLARISSASGEFWQGRSAGTDYSKSQPGDACRDDRNDPVPGEFLHEQISKTGLN